MSQDVWVYADWEEFTDPVLVGILRRKFWPCF